MSIILNEGKKLKTIFETESLNVFLHKSGWGSTAGIKVLDQLLQGFRTPQHPTRHLRLQFAGPGEL